VEAASVNVTNKHKFYLGCFHMFYKGAMESLCTTSVWCCYQLWLERYDIIINESYF